ncbi:CHCH7 protein, partial [Acromyrmex charruanus]
MRYARVSSYNCNYFILNAKSAVWCSYISADFRKKLYLFICKIFSRGIFSVGEMNTGKDLNVTERRDITSRHTLRRNQETDNPCYKEHLMSLKCLNSDKSRETCQPYFINYKNCKDFWASVQHERKLKDIKPYLPPPEERAKIKIDFLNSR